MKNFFKLLFAALALAFGVSQAQAAIVLTDFTTALDEVGTAVTAALGDTVTAGLAVAGVVMGGLLLWRLFKRIAKS